MSKEGYRIRCVVRMLRGDTESKKKLKKRTERKKYTERVELHVPQEAGKGRRRTQQEARGKRQEARTKGERG